MAEHGAWWPEFEIRSGVIQPAFVGTPQSIYGINQSKFRDESTSQLLEGDGISEGIDKHIG